MTIPVLTFFNNKGGVGKTSLVYHLAWILSQTGHRVLTCDLDPQANLSAAFLDEEQLETLWKGENGDKGATIFKCVKPLSEVGDLLPPALQEITPTLNLIPGDLALSGFEDELSAEWPKALDSGNLHRPFRILTSFWTVMQKGAEEMDATVILADVGPNLGAVNRSALIATDYVIVPLGVDMFSLQGLRNLGPTLKRWRTDWRKRRENWPVPDFLLPEGRMKPLGYIVQQYGVRLSRPVKAYDKWVNRMPEEYAKNLRIRRRGQSPASPQKDENCLATVKHYRSLIPMGQESRKPIFDLTAADGAIGSHAAATQEARRDFQALAKLITDRAGLIETLSKPKFGGKTPRTIDRPIRSEQTRFDELAVLCTSKGFIHAIAFLYFRDNMVRFNDELRAEDMAHLFSDTRLIRTEMTTLIGLMMRAPIDFTLPPPKVVFGYIEQSEKLLHELHQAMSDAGAKNITLENSTEVGGNPFTSGGVLREPIFYGGESAYTFQYRDLAPRKYRADAAWLLQNKNIDMEVGRDVCRSITALLNERLIETLKNLQDKPLLEWTVLPGFVFSCDELAARTSRSVESVRAVAEAFTVPDEERNNTFTSLHAFNAAYAYPFIRRGPDKFILLQYYGISEALYETPFYWMCDDKAYAPIALQHRGGFTESFAAERLAHVFGADRVFQNVEIFKSKGKALGEIDVLVCFGNHAIVLQAKSKKLTLPARKGNDLQLQRDFKTAVQDAVDQAFACAELLGDSSVTLRCRDGKAIRLTERPRTIFPISVVADHYPALAFQARQFLNVTPTERIVPPLVIDVFTLDTITEMLASPLRLLSYLDRRADIGDKMMASHETVLLSYHLKNNLWLENDVDLMMLHDDVSAPLDVAMAVRRDGISGEATPDGILTRFEGTPFARIVAEIEDRENSAALELGLMLLELSESTVWEINGGISQIIARTMRDGGLHDITIGISSASTGLTVHCSLMDDREAEIRLRAHCQMRQDSQKANSWFGLAIRPDGSIRFAGKLHRPQ